MKTCSCNGFLFRVCFPCWPLKATSLLPLNYYGLPGNIVFCMSVTHHVMFLTLIWLGPSPLQIHLLRQKCWLMPQALRVDCCAAAAVGSAAGPSGHLAIARPNSTEARLTIPWLITEAHRSSFKHVRRSTEMWHGLAPSGRATHCPSQHVYPPCVSCVV